jgi:hypothetical protein
MRTMGFIFALYFSAFAIAAALAADPARAQSEAEVDALHEQAAQLFKARKYQEAIPIANPRSRSASRASAPMTCAWPD